MRLTSSIIETLAATTREAKITRTKLALALNFTESWTLRCIKENKENGPLTTVKAVQVIHEETGLDQSEVLEEAETERMRA